MGKDKGAPPYVPVDIPALNKLARDYARQGYAWSDADLARRAPELGPGFNYAIGNANQNLTGAVDPLVSGGLKSAGLGAIDLGGNAFQQARNMGQPILAKEQRDRNYFQRLFSQPIAQPRGDLAGLSAKNLVEAEVVGKGDKLNYDWRNFGARVDQYGVKTQQANALGQSIGRLAGGITQQGLSSLNQRGGSTGQSPYLSPSYYNYTPAGGYGNAGFGAGSPYNYAPSNYGGTYEGNIGGQPVYRATPVDSSGGTGGGGF